MSQTAPTASTLSRTHFVSAYVVAVVLTAVVVLGLGWVVHPLGSQDLLGLAVLLALGAASARLRDVETESQIDLSFTAVILLCAVPIIGPFGAALVGALIPLFDLRRAFGPAGVFNSAMTCILGGVSGLAYVAARGWVPVPQDALGPDLLRHVAVPLLGADVVLCLVNLLVVGGMIWLHEEPGTRIPLDPFVATLPLYLGYALTGFLFVVLWGPGGVGPLAAAFVVAPLVVARWAYVQYIDESQSRSRILHTLAAAGESRDGSELRVARIDWLARNLETQLGLTGGAAVALRYAATLHDIGTVAVPREILSRDPDELTPAQLRVVASHAQTGFAVLRDIDFLDETAHVVRHHHERWDGRGYPDQLAGNDIPLPARILGVIDAYEALAWSAGDEAPARHAEALAQIRTRSGTQFDPDVVDALGVVIGESPQPPSPLVDGFVSKQPQPWVVSSRPRPRLRHAHPRVSDLLAREQVGPGPQPARPAPGNGALRRARGRGADLLRRHLTVRNPLGGADLVALIVAGAVILAAVFAVGGDRPPAGQAPMTVILVYFVVLVIAERFRLRLRGRLETAPTAAAAGIALALTSTLPGTPAVGLRTVDVLSVVLAAQAVDWVVVRRRLPATERFEAIFDAAIRSTSVVLISVVVRGIPWSGEPLLATLSTRPGWWQALVLTTVVGLVILLEIPPRAARRAEVERTRWRDTVAEEVRDSVGLGSAMAGTGVLLAIAQQTLGLIAVPLLLLPLAITQLAVRRYSLTQLAYLQSVRALSRLPELAGVVRAGHAKRVAAVAVALGRELHLREAHVVELEYAALLHDIGQVTLRRPIPFGATVLAAPADQDRIARHGARILEHTGALADVAQVVRDQAVPYHQVMGTRGRNQLASRVVKVANAFDDYLASDPDADATDALERLYLGLGHEFDPRVVRALEAYVRRYGDDLSKPAATGGA
ncbi:MAG: HD domain-containing phosphohydrolase [Micrococcales bacterium]|nr:HD domain-containing phosphohydrolase [Micrococcales bacterium]